MGSRELVTTSVSIPNELLDKAKMRAASTYRTFSQYVSFLIDQDLDLADVEKLRKAELNKNAERPMR